MAQFFDVRGEWEARQSNGFVVDFVIHKQVLRVVDPAFTDVFGTASQRGATVEGRVDGAVSGNQFFALVFWNKQSQGKYFGTFGLLQAVPRSPPYARITGYTHDRMNPQDQATWYTADKFLLSDF